MGVFIQSRLTKFEVLHFKDFKNILKIKMKYRYGLDYCGCGNNVKPI